MENNESRGVVNVCVGPGAPWEPGWEGGICCRARREGVDAASRPKEEKDRGLEEAHSLRERAGVSSGKQGGQAGRPGGVGPHGGWGAMRMGEL